MTKRKKRESIIQNKLLFTVLILFIYMLGREIPLYGIDVDAYREVKLNAEDILMQTISGDVYRYSIFALGISPYMISSIIVQMATYYKKSVSNVKVSMIKSNRATVAMTLVLAILQAVFHVNNLSFKEFGSDLWLVYIVAIIEMITGVMLIMWFSERNKKFGIGGQTALILVNIIDGVMGTILGQPIDIVKLPLIISIILIPIVLLMENAEKRIPIQRVSIHNIYADRNYLAIKLNPIGVMPVMFAAAFFMLPQLLANIMLQFFPNIEVLFWLQNNLNLDKVFGVAVYIGILYLLTIIFSSIMLSPSDLAEEFLKSGDSIVNLHAGNDTKKYLKKSVFHISIFSSTIMGICIGIPLILQINGNIDSALVMLPSSIMMLTGLWCNIFMEVKAVRSFSDYRPFI